MKISVIAAVGKNRVIGRAGKLPWSLPADLSRFKKITMGKPVIMGRKTADSLKGPLAGRVNIVVSRQGGYQREGFVSAKSLKEALKMSGQAKAGEVFVIGGEQIYKLALPLADRLFITEIDQEFEGDAFFPQINSEEWEEYEVVEGSRDEHNIYPHRFKTYTRKQSG